MGIGQSTCVGIGGYPTNGINFIDVLNAFNRDPETKAVIMIGKIGGSAEEEAAQFIKEWNWSLDTRSIAGQAAPGKAHGACGEPYNATSGGKGTAQEKIEQLEANGVKVARSLQILQKH